MRSTRRITIAAGALAALAVALPGAALAAPGDGELVNPGFEDGLSGWTVSSTTGDDAAAKVEGDGHEASSGRLTHWADEDYAVTTSQSLDGLATGWWTASAWVKSGGALDATRLALTGCGVDDSTTTPITEQDDRWVRLAVSAYVTDGDCTLSVATDGAAGAWATIDDVVLERGRVTREVRGGDLSGVAKNEDVGATYADADGAPGDPYEILADAGMNLGRLKVWVDPADGYNEITHVVESARRITDAGMDLMVDFHYSDRWTDPGAQEPPPRGPPTPRRPTTRPASSPSTCTSTRTRCSAPSPTRGSPPTTCRWATRSTRA
ncbi:hypothetical protein GCM10025865_07270 [Paraoerskovia sediminicola]|uniref:Arabinogalactan endo-beta-1,4-galactanase n=1 Tax=Paraoerskovia sediminicola TaxID=1138587 RepID=A0ABM8G023_9CELL|nr:hypothetical protein GCM10025865_07270 [Paraoerskovia sediminicola]